MARPPWVASVASRCLAAASPYRVHCQKSVVVAITTFIQCYYGFFASGGPEGVGVAAGRAIKMCIILVVFADLFMTLAIWGVNPGIRISG